MGGLIRPFRASHDPSARYDPGFEEDGDDADLDGGADEVSVRPQIICATATISRDDCFKPQPQILNCVVHFFETRFDPFDGAPVDRTAKWIAPLYDRVAFYEIILGLQLLDAPTMIHDSQVEAEDVRMYAVAHHLYLLIRTSRKLCAPGIWRLFHFWKKFYKRAASSCPTIAWHH